VYLLDSHVLIWHKDDDERLPQSISKLIEDHGTKPLWVSTASWWEMTIKEGKKALKIRGGITALRADWIESGAAENLVIQWNHIKKLRELPEVHKDPFDRMLVAQALVENLTIITGDPHIPKYPGVKTIWSF